MREYFDHKIRQQSKIMKESLISMTVQAAVAATMAVKAGGDVGGQLQAGVQRGNKCRSVTTSQDDNDRGCRGLTYS